MKGVVGEPGIEGPQGEPGDYGYKGFKGDYGDKGQKGANGDSAAVNATRGDIGEKGLQGETGIVGDTGDIGFPGIRGPPGLRSGGLTYISWGRTVCPNTTGTELVYKGRAAGSHYRFSGGGVNYLCLPDQPEDYIEETGLGFEGYLYGTSYQTYANQPYNHNSVPCVACFTRYKMASLMIPAKITCPSGWTQEYYGYLMTSATGNRKSTFECVDVSMETLSGNSNDDGAIFHHVKVDCNSFFCPPYNQDDVLTCVVCSK